MIAATSPAAALVDALSEIDCPVARAEQIGRVAREFGNLPPPLAMLRGRALDEAVTARHRVADLADRLGLSKGRLYEILREFRTRIGPVPTADPAPSCAAASVPPPDTEPLESARPRKTADAADLHATVPTAAAREATP